jgi:hypothetical protein
MMLGGATYGSVAYGSRPGSGITTITIRSGQRSAVLLTRSGVIPLGSVRSPLSVLTTRVALGSVLQSNAKEAVVLSTQRTAATPI